MHFAMVSSVGQVPPGDGCVPVNAVLAMAYESRLALFQSIGLVAMCNMAYEGEMQIANWALVANLRFTLGNNLT